MYSDRAKKRDHVVKLRFSDEEMALVDAFVRYTGEQKAVLLREIIVRHLAGSLLKQEDSP